MGVLTVFAFQTTKLSTKTKERMKKMHDKILKEAEAICGIMFPNDEENQCLLYHHLALFADFVEVQALIQFRNELNVSQSYLSEEIKHG